MKNKIGVALSDYRLGKDHRRTLGAIIKVPADTFIVAERLARAGCLDPVLVGLRSRIRRAVEAYLQEADDLISSVANFKDQ